MSEIFFKKRDDRFDSIRGLAMIGIVFIHVNSYFEYFHSSDDYPVIITLILSNLSRFSVPVFIFSAGYFSRDKDFKSYWSPKLISIFLPFLIFSVLGFFIKSKEWDIEALIYNIFLGRSMTPYYFIPLLFQFYFLYFIGFKYLTKRLLIPSTIIALVINYFSNSGYLDLIKGDYEAISITNYIFFFFLGLLASHYKLDDVISTNLKKIFIRGVFGLFGIAIIYYSIIDGIHMKNHTLLYPTITFVMLYGMRFHEVISKELAVVGKESMGVFLIHPFLIHFMHSIDPYSWAGSYGSILIVAILNVILPLLIWFAILKLFSIAYRP